MARENENKGGGGGPGLGLGQWLGFGHLTMYEIPYVQPNQCPPWRRWHDRIEGEHKVEELPKKGVRGVRGPGLRGFSPMSDRRVPLH